MHHMAMTMISYEEIVSNNCLMADGNENNFLPNTLEYNPLSEVFLSNNFTLIMILMTGFDTCSC